MRVAQAPFGLNLWTMLGPGNLLERRDGEDLLGMQKSLEVHLNGLLGEQ